MKKLLTIILFLSLASFAIASRYVGYDKYEEFGVSAPEAVAPSGGTYWDTAMTARWNTAMTALWNTSMDTEIP